MTKFFGLLTLAFFLIGLTSPALAQENATPPTQSETNSYVLFWPLVAGKTQEDKLYFLKIAKEKVRGWLIFDKTTKADYAILLGTKRMLELEKLLKEGKTKPAAKTLKNADSNFSKSYGYIKNAVSDGKFDAGKIRRDRLINVKSLIDQLKTLSPTDMQDELNTAKGKVERLLSDYLP